MNWNYLRGGACMVNLFNLFFGRNARNVRNVRNVKNVGNGEMGKCENLEMGCLARYGAICML